MNNQRANYRIDAPGLVRTFYTVGSAAGAVPFGLCFKFSQLPMFVIALVALAILICIYCLAMGSFMIFYSSVQKIKDREKLFNLINWESHEMVIDVGCGLGLMLVGAAKRLSSGKAVEFDLWLVRDQSGH